ncbi:MAG: phospholipase D-like domain-containing protein [Proteobacteria bacterium]|nr:phospholipase D-like domain-containing protein [Pseudomonadota bacterium]
MNLVKGTKAMLSLTSLRLVPIASLLLFSSVVHAKVDVFFSPNGGVKEGILANLDGAVSSVDIAMYSFSDRDIQNKVVEISKNGVKVRLILNAAKKQEALTERFEAAGIDVRYINPIMHHKFALIDGPRSNRDSSKSVLITGSANWSSSSNSKYDEDFLIFKNENARISAFQGEFEYVWTHARDIAGAGTVVDVESFEPFTDENSFFTSANFEPFELNGEWSFRSKTDASLGVAGTQVVKAIESAKVSIHIATTHFRRKDFYDALAAAVSRGVEVRMILDQQEYQRKPPPADPESAGNLYFDEKLAKEGVDVRYKAYMLRWDAAQAKQMHSKYMIVDGKRVITGSFNWSENSEVGTFENLILLKGPIAASYEGNFLSILSRNDSELAPLMLKVDEERGRGPCAFEPMALSGLQMQELWSHYHSGACARRP